MYRALDLAGNRLGEVGHLGSEIGHLAQMASYKADIRALWVPLKGAPITEHAVEVEEAEARSASSQLPSLSKLSH